MLRLCATLVVCAANEWIPMRSLSANRMLTDILDDVSVAPLDAVGLSVDSTSTPNIDVTRNKAELVVTFSFPTHNASEARCSVVREPDNVAQKPSPADVFKRRRSTQDWLDVFVEDICSENAEDTSMWIIDDDSHGCKRPAEHRASCEWILTMQMEGIPVRSWNRGFRIECATRGFDQNAVFLPGTVAVHSLPSYGFSSWKNWITDDRIQYKIGALNLEFTVDERENVTCYFHVIAAQDSSTIAVVPSNVSLVIAEANFYADNSKWTWRGQFQWPNLNGYPAILRLASDRRALMQCAAGNSFLVSNVTFSNFLEGSCECGCNERIGSGLCSCAPSCVAQGNCCIDYLQYCSRASNSSLSCVGRLYNITHSPVASNDNLAGTSADDTVIFSSVEFRPCGCQQHEDTNSYQCGDYEEEANLESAYEKDSLGSHLNITEEGTLEFFHDRCTGPRQFQPGGGTSHLLHKCSPAPVKCTVSFPAPETCDCPAVNALQHIFPPLPSKVPGIPPEPSALTANKQMCTHDLLNMPDSVPDSLRPHEIVVQLEFDHPRCSVCEFGDKMKCKAVTAVPARTAGSYILKVPTDFREKSDVPTDVRAKCRGEGKAFNNDLMKTQSTPGFKSPVTEISQTLVTQNSIKVSLSTSNNESGWCHFVTDSEFLSTPFDGMAGELTFTDEDAFVPGQRVEVQCLTSSGISSHKFNMTIPGLVMIGDVSETQIASMVTSACPSSCNCRRQEVQAKIVSIGCEAGTDKTGDFITAMKAQVANATYVGYITTTTTTTPGPPDGVPVVLVVDKEVADIAHLVNAVCTADTCTITEYGDNVVVYSTFHDADVEAALRGMSGLSTFALVAAASIQMDVSNVSAAIANLRTECPNCVGARSGRGIDVYIPATENWADWKTRVSSAVLEADADATIVDTTTTTTTSTTISPSRLETTVTFKLDPNYVNKTERRLRLESFVKSVCPEKYECEQTVDEMEDNVLVVLVVMTPVEDADISSNEDPVNAFKKLITEKLDDEMKRDLGVEWYEVKRSPSDWADYTNVIYAVAAAILGCCLIIGIISFARRRAQHTNGSPMRKLSSFTKWFDENDLECGVIPNDEPRRKSVKMWTEDETVPRPSRMGHGSVAGELPRVSGNLSRSSSKLWLDGEFDAKIRPCDVENTDTVLTKLRRVASTTDVNDGSHLGDWFYFDETHNAEVGPFTLEQMRLWFNRGAIHPTTKVRKDGTEHSARLFAPIMDWFPEGRANAFVSEPNCVPSSLTTVSGIDDCDENSKDSWYYQDEWGREVGPLGKKNLEEWLSCQQISNSTQIRQGGQDAGTRSVQDVLDDSFGCHVLWEYVGDNDIEGSYTTQQMRTRYRDGRLGRTSLIKNNFMEQWAPIQHVFFEMQDVFEQNDEEYENAHRTGSSESSYRGMEYGKASRVERCQTDISSHREPVSKTQVSKKSTGRKKHSAKTQGDAQDAVPIAVAERGFERLMDVGESPSDWFYFDESSQVEVGPFSLDQMRQYFDNRKILKSVDISQAKVRQGGGARSHFAPVRDWYPTGTPFQAVPEITPPVMEVTAVNVKNVETDAWFYVDTERACEVGPFKKSELEMWLESKQITEGTGVRRIGSTVRVSVSEVLRSGGSGMNSPEKSDLQTKQLNDVGESANDWYYFDESREVEIGPFSLDQMRLCFSSKKLLGKQFTSAAKVRQGGEPHNFAPIHDWYPEAQPFFTSPEAIPPTVTEVAAAKKRASGSPQRTRRSHGTPRSADTKGSQESWFYKDDEFERTVGPFSHQQLEYWAGMGQIGTATLVWNDDKSQRAKLCFSDAFHKGGNANDWMWDFVGAKTGNVEGPYTTMGMEKQLQTGNVNAASMVKNELMDSWAPLQEVFPQMDKAFQPYVTRMTNYSQWQHEAPGKKDMSTHTTAERRRGQAARRKAMLETIEQKYNIKAAEFSPKVQARQVLIESGSTFADETSMVTTAIPDTKHSYPASGSSGPDGALSRDDRWLGSAGASGRSKPLRQNAHHTHRRGPLKDLQDADYTSTRIPDGRSPTRLRPATPKPHSDEVRNTRPYSPMQADPGREPVRSASRLRGQEGKAPAQAVRSASRIRTRTPNPRDEGTTSPWDGRSQSRMRQDIRPESRTRIRNPPGVEEPPAPAPEVRSQSRMRRSESRTASRMRARTPIAGHEGDHSANKPHLAYARTDSRLRQYDSRNANIVNTRTNRREEGRMRAGTGTSENSPRKLYPRTDSALGAGDGRSVSRTRRP